MKNTRDNPVPNTIICTLMDSKVITRKVMERLNMTENVNAYDAKDFTTNASNCILSRKLYEV